MGTPTRHGLRCPLKDLKDAPLYFPEIWIYPLRLVFFLT